MVGFLMIKVGLSTFYLFGCLDIQTDGSFVFSSAPPGTFFDGGAGDAEWINMKIQYC